MLEFKTWFYEEAQRRGTCSFYETATPDDIPVEYHKYFERKWRTDKEAAETGEPQKNIELYNKRGAPRGMAPLLYCKTNAKRRHNQMVIPP